MPTLTIDNAAVPFEPGETILQAASRAGIAIPTLCNLEGIEPPTSCYVCVVKIQGKNGMAPSCATLAEEGIKGADVSTWYGLYATAGTPRPAVERLAAELARVLKLPEVQTRIRDLGGEIHMMSTAQFAEMNKTEYEHYGRLVRAANIKAE